MIWVGRCRDCGKVVAACRDHPDYSLDVKDMIEGNLDVNKVETEVVAIDGCCCKYIAYTTEALENLANLADSAGFDGECVRKTLKMYKENVKNV